MVFSLGPSKARDRSLCMEVLEAKLEARWERKPISLIHLVEPQTG